MPDHIMLGLALALQGFRHHHIDPPLQFLLRHLLPAVGATFSASVFALALDRLADRMVENATPEAATSSRWVAPGLAR